MDSIKTQFSSLSLRSRAGLLSGTLLILAASMAALWWLLTPKDQLLFGNLKEADAAEIVASLEEWKLPYRIVDGGSGIEVPEDIVYETRMRLVSAGVPRGGHVGFELFDDSDFGVTDFAQRVNYQRALQGEIERTISAMPGIASARVHLTIRRPGLLSSGGEGSKASVALAMEPGVQLERTQVDGIRSLVAAAVDGLSIGSVAIVDARGSLLATTGADAGVPASVERVSSEEEIEKAMTTKLEALLGRYFAKDEFAVSVDATLNYDSVHEVSERPVAPVGGSLLVRKRGIAGSDAADDDVAGGQELEYAHGTSRQEIARAPGRIEKLSVAVILPTRLDELEVARIRALVEAATGINEPRGDRLEVLRFGGTETRAATMTDAPEATSPVIEPTAIESPRSTGGKPPVGAYAWLRWGLLAVLAILVGAIVSVAMRRRPRALHAREREALLAQMKVWLVEGKVES